ncbi:hypothetical protein niasHT_033977 [Heterodera trifolii]|uniref:Uncharacterized protein n=1 Tax=Heterodera trifolii TaxID=157864 RepID=A0ABD2IBD1_9BILA
MGPPHPPSTQEQDQSFQPPGFEEFPEAPSVDSDAENPPGTNENGVAPLPMLPAPLSNGKTPTKETNKLGSPPPIAPPAFVSKPNTVQTNGTMTAAKQMTVLTNATAQTTALTP